MLAHRVIPVMLCRGRQLIKGERFNGWRTVGVAAQAVHIHNRRGVDELCLLDIAATPEGRGPDLSLVEELSQTCFMPLSVGGGIRTLQDIRNLLNAGADKVVIGAGAYLPYDLPDRPRCPGGFINAAAERFGSQAIVVAMNMKGGIPHTYHGAWKGSDLWTPRLWAFHFQNLGAGEILLTAMDREGTMQGYDLDLIRRVSEAVDIPVIANGGCSGPEDMVAAIKAGASAVAAGALFQFTDVTPRDCAKYLAGQGIEARV